MRKNEDTRLFNTDGAKYSGSNFSAVRMLVEFKTLYTGASGGEDEWPSQYKATIDDMLYSLEGGAVADMVPLLDVRSLAPSYWNQTGTRRRPRISLSVDLIDGDDLSITWHNGHFDLNRQRMLPVDWLGAENEDFGLPGRPGNELLFVRNIGQLRYIGTQVDEKDKWVASSLLGILNAIINAKTLFLLSCFETQWLSCLKINFANTSALASPTALPLLGDEIASGFTIVDLIEEERNKLMRFLKSFADNYRISAEEFWTMVQSRVVEEGEAAFAGASDAIRRRTGILMKPAEVRTNLELVRRAIDANICRLDPSVIPFNRS